MMEFKPVVFQIGTEKYGVDITLVRGIENLQPVVPVPNAGRNVKGIINLRGDVIPVFSLRSKFAMAEQKDAEEKKLIIVQTAECLLALEVDRVEEIQAVTSDMIHQPPILIKGQETGYVKEIVGMSDQLIIIIDVDNILTEAEKAEIQEMLKEK